MTFENFKMQSFRASDWEYQKPVDKREFSNFFFIFVLLFQRSQHMLHQLYYCRASLVRRLYDVDKRLRLDMPVYFSYCYTYVPRNPMLSKPVALTLLERCGRNFIAQSLVTRQVSLSSRSNTSSLAWSCWTERIWWHFQSWIDCLACWHKYRTSSRSSGEPKFASCETFSMLSSNSSNDTHWLQRWVGLWLQLCCKALSPALLREYTLQRSATQELSLTWI